MKYISVSFVIALLLLASNSAALASSAFVKTLLLLASKGSAVTNERFIFSLIIIMIILKKKNTRKKMKGETILILTKIVHTINSQVNFKDRVFSVSVMNGGVQLRFQLVDTYVS